MYLDLQIPDLYIKYQNFLWLLTEDILKYEL